MTTWLQPRPQILIFAEFFLFGQSRPLFEFTYVFLVIGSVTRWYNKSFHIYSKVGPKVAS